MARARAAVARQQMHVHHRLPPKQLTLTRASTGHFLGLTFNVYTPTTDAASTATPTAAAGSPSRVSLSGAENTTFVHITSVSQGAAGVEALQACREVSFCCCCVPDVRDPLLLLLLLLLLLSLLPLLVGWLMLSHPFLCIHSISALRLFVWCSLFTRCPAVLTFVPAFVAALPWVVHCPAAFVALRSLQMMM